jgi:hypothetical protein
MDWEDLVSHILIVDPCVCHTFDVWKGTQGRYKALCTRCDFETSCEQCAKVAIRNIKNGLQRPDHPTKSHFVDCFVCPTIQLIDVCVHCWETTGCRCYET